MSHRTEPTPDHANRERVDDAVRVLARLLARQTAGEFRMPYGDEDEPVDAEIECHGKE